MGAHPQMRAVRLLGKAFPGVGGRLPLPLSPLWTSAGPRRRTGFIICKAQRKRRVQDHLFKKPEKRVKKSYLFKEKSHLFKKPEKRYLR